MNSSLLRTIYTLSFLLVSSMTTAQESSFQSSLDSICLKSGYPGIVFSYVDANNQIQSYASGWADKENEIAMSSRHKMHGGSTGKTIVSAVLMQLVIEGKISLDDKVSKYLGTYNWFNRLANSEQITIRHLMQHSSGIIRYEFKEAFLVELNANPDKVWKPEELLAYVLDDEPPFAAGEGFTYADTNYILLGMIIEKITGNSFYEEAKVRVLKPLGLESFSETLESEIPNMAQGYYDEGSEYALGFKSPFLINGVAQNNMQFEWTGGGYAFETGEYAFLLKQLYEGNVFDLSKVEEDYFGFIDAQEIRGQYGLGVIRYEFPGLGEFIGHSGFFPGYNTMGFYHPATGQSFAMQVNSTELPHLQRFFSDYLTLLRKLLE